MINCPLSGGPAGVEDGTLTIRIGGNEKALTGITSSLKSVGDHIEYIEPSGAGQTLKLCDNMIVGGVLTLLS
ncbi:NAD(P)-binding domain-containing protein [Virgibacillus byunsanensis]|uniref:NAD(P)-binding domain-containing protein n=1 Tax=Virgibacillus byunsanensis TaxID=570945 RepID=A0ABW3LII5_9BACI